MVMWQKIIDNAHFCY